MSARATAETRSGAEWTRALEGLAPELARRGPAWLAELRESARAAFARSGFPGPRAEEWRYTRLGPIARGSFAPAAGALPVRIERGQLEARLPELPGALRLVFADGRHVSELSSPPGEVRGLRAGSLAALLASEPELARPFLAQLALPDEHLVATLSTASFEDGAFVHVARGAAPGRPIHVVHLATARAEALALYPRGLYVLEEGAQATLVESYLGLGAGPSFTGALSELYLGPGAQLDRYELQDEAPAAFHLSYGRARLERSASLRSHSFALGAEISRSELHVELAGEGAECNLAGLYVLDGERRAECRTLVDHALPHAQSLQDFRGILDGRSRGAFAGLVRVRPDAQKSDARQQSRSLVLSRDARADTKPELDIHADDVKCAHGAVVGRLDEGQVFYLRSRGIDEAAARRALTRAFAVSIVDGVRPEGLRAAIEALLDRILERGSSQTPD